MDNSIQELIEKIKKLEQQLVDEVQKKEEEFFYEVHAKKVRFKKDAKERGRQLTKKIPPYIRDASFFNLLTAPIIWSCIIPALFMDLVISFYQATCFPIYGVPKVRRGDYIIIDRHALPYLNIIEKINCIYCGYFNGLIAFTQEIAARTEQYWCPIKHARKLTNLHSRYRYFFEYGDARKFRQQIEKLRREFDDLR